MVRSLLIDHMSGMIGYLKRSIQTCKRVYDEVKKNTFIYLNLRDFSRELYPSSSWYGLPKLWCQLTTWMTTFPLMCLQMPFQMTQIAHQRIFIRVFSFRYGTKKTSCNTRYLKIILKWLDYTTLISCNLSWVLVRGFLRILFMKSIVNVQPPQMKETFLLPNLIVVTN